MNASTPAVPAGTGLDTQSLPGIGLKPWLSLRRHWRLALAAALLVLLAGTPIAWIQGRSVYVAEAVFQVAPTFMKNVETDAEVQLQSNSQYREYVNHLSNTVTRQDVLQRAIADLEQRGIRLRGPEQTERKFIEQLRRTLYVRAVPDTYMVRIGMQDPQREHLHELVNAVARSFVETSRAEQIYGSPQRLEVLQEATETLQAEVAQFESQRTELAERLGLTSFRENAENPYDTSLQQARERLAAATVERLQAQAALDAFRSRGEVPTQFGRSLMEMRLQDNGLQALRNEVVKRTEELNRAMAGLSPRHPVQQAAEAELRSLEQRLQQREAAFDRETRTNFEARLLASLNLRAQVEREVGESLRQLQAQATSYARDFQQAMQLTSELRKREAELEKLRDRLNYLDTETRAIGFVRLVTEALPAETPQGAGRKKLLLMVLAAALGATLLLPMALDLLDRRVASVNDAEKLMGIPAAGWQVRIEDLPTQLFAQQQTRRFAATVLRNRDRGGRRVFAFTAVEPGAGVTRTVDDLAGELARLGERVLVVQADTLGTRRQATDCSPGLTDLLAGLTPLSQLATLARPVTVDGATFERVPVGTRVGDGVRRLDLLTQAVQAWSESHDVVLFDLSPILLSADAEMLVEKLGQVFLVVEAQAASRGEILRARRRLQQIEPEAVGLVVNRVPVFRGAGYMESLIAETLTGHRVDDFGWKTRLQLWWAARQARRATRRR